ncbi:hypothetical protein PENSUB_6252 [Penicillium subrubescens]|uniref:Uncharacterized protein n=1 Tax=Penicillium subrubescens TaxID=1316194 RepID=A0A1Q5U1A5_9EURO|nr:hypothetical protein PENSUB_6252 [Penicillium subrubescens]
MACPDCYWPSVLKSVENLHRQVCAMLGLNSDVGTSLPGLYDGNTIKFVVGIVERLCPPIECELAKYMDGKPASSKTGSGQWKAETMKTAFKSNGDIDPAL